jgi:hypothetical protein
MEQLMIAVTALGSYKHRRDTKVDEHWLPAIIHRDASTADAGALYTLLKVLEGMIMPEDVLDKIITDLRAIEFPQGDIRPTVLVLEKRRAVAAST